MLYTRLRKICSNQAGPEHNVFGQTSMKIMTRSIHNLVVVASVIFLLAAGLSQNLRAQDASQPKLTKEEIFQKSKAAYAALNSYSDEGQVVHLSDGPTVATYMGTRITENGTRVTNFTTRLSRPNLYRITWRDNYSDPAAAPLSTAMDVWSMGDGDYLNMGFGKPAEKQKTMEDALAGATGISSGAAAEVPAAFFNTKWANPFCCLAKGLIQQADEKVGEVDCYVFAGGTKDRTRTIWIGKQDFLIRQIRETSSAAAMKAIMDQIDKDNPADDHPKIEPTGITSIETHSNIVVNQKFVEADFFPATAK